jgi:hypothetical protein
MFWKYPLKIQAYDTKSKNNYTMEFADRKEHLAYCKLQFKMPKDKYSNLGYDLTKPQIEAFQEMGLQYTKTQVQSKKPNFEGGSYTNAIKGTHRWKIFWANEKDKVLNGYIVDGTFFPPFYYWYGNYCPIYDAVALETRLGDVWDGDLWYFHYVMICILSGKHIGGIKGRQKGYSFKHMAILYWSYAWKENSVNTIGAYDESLVEKSWKFLEMYRKHLNSSFSAWKRGPKIAKSLKWIEVTMDVNEQPHGLGSKLSGVTLRQSASKDVGGSQTFFNYEEPGVSPTILKTLEYIRPALERGSVTTGYIIACGSVGDLDDAAGIKKIMYYPDSYNFYGIPNVWDEDPETPNCCIFISEAYNMQGDYNGDGTGEYFMDECGNSNVPLAMKWIDEKLQQLKNSSKSQELKQLAESQKCTSPAQAFKERKVSMWPIDLITRQQERITLKTTENKWAIKPKKGLLFLDDDGRIKLKTDKLPPEHGYPVKPGWTDKRGVVTIYEPPDKNAEWLTYFAGVDPIEAESTTTSDSLFSIDIFKTVIEVEYEDEKGNIKKRLEGDKLVATYRGRFDDSNGGTDATNEQGELLIKLYNAFAYIERNKPSFINHMNRRGLGRYVATEADVPMFKDINITADSGKSKDGFYMDSTGKVNDMLNASLKSYLMSQYNAEFKKDKNGELTEEVVKIYRGLDRIDDYWALEELKQHGPSANTDRRVSLAAAIHIAKVYQNNRYIKKRSEIQPKAIAPNQGSFSFIKHTTNTKRSLINGR